MESHETDPRAAGSIVGVLEERARQAGDRLAFRFDNGPGEPEERLTYRELHERVIALAHRLRERTKPGERALLLYPPGLDFVVAFFACLSARVVAVPVPPPRRKHQAASLEAIARSAAPTLLLGTSPLEEELSTLLPSSPGFVPPDFLATDRPIGAPGPPQAELPADPTAVALLQYTSGSTSSPRGVRLTHANLLANCALIQRAFGTNEEVRALFWLPHYHDMGLIGGIVQPVYCGASTTLMPPGAVAARPLAWLEAISRHRATISGGPNFAYEMCARRVTPADVERLDLGCWSVAFTGAETVRAETLERFAARFEPAGFRRQAFLPCYGLAEATLLVTGGPGSADPTLLEVDADELRFHRVRAASAGGGRTLVGCGSVSSGQELEIVDPETLRPVPAGAIGEIWVRGPSVAAGYEGEPEAERETFQSRIGGGEGSPHLRTGDLGFVRDDQLFVIGRSKDLIILRGRNHHAEDIERSLEGVHEALRVGHSAAFSIDAGVEEQLVVVHEVDPRWRRGELGGAIDAIRNAVASRHEVGVDRVLLVKGGAIPRTSSGKIRRAACRMLLLDGELPLLAEWREPRPQGGDDAPSCLATHGAAGPDPREIAEWITSRVALRLALPPEAIGLDTPFAEIGLGSADAVALSAELERWLGRRLSPTLVYRHPTILSLAESLALPPSMGRAGVESEPLPAVPSTEMPSRNLEAETLAPLEATDPKWS
jgi:acyl-CoA synthetase (AMP-forming)/AMP-acid ligase II/acyl carrier protein